MFIIGRVVGDRLHPNKSLCIITKKSPPYLITHYFYSSLSLIFIEAYKFVYMLQN